jgi:hypothetical protein
VANHGTSTRVSPRGGPPQTRRTVRYVEGVEGNTSALAIDRASLPRAAIDAATGLRPWLESTGLLGVDPYDALRSPVVRRLARTPRLRQIAVQALRRLPVDARPLLGIGPHENAKGIAIVAAASAKLWSATGDEAWRALASRAAETAADLALETAAGPAWGYPFDVQVRWGYYRSGTPNAIASVFTAGGLIVTGDLLGRDDLVGKGEAVTPFLDSLAAEAGGGQFYAYVPGNRTPIHNASMLVAALRARIAQRRGEDTSADVLAAVDYSIRRQRSDGSWPYGEGRGLGWVDGYHTAYVLCALIDLLATTNRDDVERALSSGSRFYLDELFGLDGLPLMAPGHRYPLDAHNVATAVTTLARVAGREPRALHLAGRALDVALSRLRTKQGWFIYQRGRLHAKRPAYFRWSNAHMLNAFAELAGLYAEPRSVAQGAVVPVP